MPHIHQFKSRRYFVIVFFFSGSNTVVKTYATLTMTSYVRVLHILVFTLDGKYIELIADETNALNPIKFAKH